MYIPPDYNPELDTDIELLTFRHSYKQKFPLLAEPYKKVMSCSASSAPSERVFSKTGLRMTPRRSRSFHDTVSRLVYLDMNYELL